MSKIDIRMERARAKLIRDHPFLGTLSLYLQIIEDPSVETMSTNGSDCRYAPAFLDTISQAEIDGVFAHEVFHCAYRHHLRRGNRDPDVWNDAGDYIINRDLRKLKLALPKGHLYDPQYAKLCEEEVYARLMAKRQPPPPEQGQGDPQEGEGQGDTGNPSQPQSGNNGQGEANAQPQPPAGDPSKGAGQGKGTGQPQNGTPASPAEAQQGTQPAQPGTGTGTGAGQSGKVGSSSRQPGRVTDGAPSHDVTEISEQETEWKRRVQEALNVAKAANAGNLPGEWEELAKINNKSEIDWRETLRRFIDSKVVTDYSWTNPNKRFLQSGYILPGIRADGVNRLGVGVDASSSTGALVNQFFAELAEALDLGLIEELIVVQCDTRVTGVDRYRKGETIKTKVYGRGGTRFSPVFEWFEENEPDVAGIVYFTDMECRDYGQEPVCPVMWMAYGPTSILDEYTKGVPFGEIVRIDNPN